MVFGVFASRKDSPTVLINEAMQSMLRSYNKFLEHEKIKSDVASIASKKIGLPIDRVRNHFESEVSNTLDNTSIDVLVYSITKGSEQSSEPS